MGRRGAGSSRPPARRRSLSACHSGPASPGGGPEQRRRARTGRRCDVADGDEQLGQPGAEEAGRRRRPAPPGRTADRAPAGSARALEQHATEAVDEGGATARARAGRRRRPAATHRAEHHAQRRPRRAGRPPATARGVRCGRRRCHGDAGEGAGAEQGVQHPCAARPRSSAPEGQHHEQHVERPEDDVAGEGDAEHAEQPTDRRRSGRQRRPGPPVALRGAVRRPARPPTPIIEDVTGATTHDRAAGERRGPPADEEDGRAERARRGRWRTRSGDPEVAGGELARSTGRRPAAARRRSAAGSTAPRATTAPATTAATASPAGPAAAPARRSRRACTARPPQRRTSGRSSFVSTRDDRCPRPAWARGSPSDTRARRRAPPASNAYTSTATTAPYSATTASRWAVTTRVSAAVGERPRRVPTGALASSRDLRLRLPTSCYRPEAGRQYRFRRRWTAHGRWACGGSCSPTWSGRAGCAAGSATIGPMTSRRDHDRSWARGRPATAGRWCAGPATGSRPVSPARRLRSRPPSTCSAAVEPVRAERRRGRAVPDPDRAQRGRGDRGRRRHPRRRGHRGRAAGGHGCARRDPGDRPRPAARRAAGRRRVRRRAARTRSRASTSR